MISRRGTSTIANNLSVLTNVTDPSYSYEKHFYMFMVYYFQLLRACVVRPVFFLSISDTITLLQVVPIYFPILYGEI